MSEMEERVARAICCPEGCSGDTGSGRPCNIRGEDRTSMRQARAAIEAMWEACNMTDITQALAKFAMWAMMEGSWQGDDIDGGAAQDKAEALGLIVKTQYDPTKHGANPYCEPGDAWYVPSEAMLSALSPAVRPPVDNTGPGA